MQHILKIWPDFFHAIVIGEKVDQLRRDDRNFQKGDTLLLRGYDPKVDRYLGKTCEVNITDVTRNFEGLQPGYCILSIRLFEKSNRWVPDLAGKTAAEVEEMDKQQEISEAKRLKEQAQLQHEKEEALQHVEKGEEGKAGSNHPSPVDSLP